MSLRNHRVAAVAAGAAILVGFGSFGAVAAGLIDSAHIKNETIKSVDIKNGEVKKADVGTGAVGSSELADGSVRLGDLSSSTVDALKGQAAETVIRSLKGGAFLGTNASVSLTGDGVQFGPYVDGGAAGGSLNFTGLNGKKLSDVKNLAYYARYVSKGDTTGTGAPYLRIFFAKDAAGNEHDAIFSPNTQSPDADVAEGPFHEWVATSGSWRYDDDGAEGADVSFADLVKNHGDQKIAGIYISTGFTSGTDLASLVRWVEVNGQTFSFRG